MHLFYILRRTTITGILAGLLLVPAAAHAAQTYNVNSTTDADNSTAESACTSGATGCTLRAAITDANSNAGSTISVQAGTYTLLVGLLTLSANTTIFGADSSTTIIDGNSATQVLVINSGVTASISDVTIRNAKTTATDGAAIKNNGSLTVSDSVFSSNTTSNGGGGAISSPGTLTISDSTFTNNTYTGSACCGGGAVINGGSGTMTVTGSTFTGNSAPNATFGGGAIFQGGGSGSITGSSITGNSTKSSGGGVLNFGSLTITNSTIAENTAASGGGIFQNSGTLILSYSTIGKNIAGSGVNLANASGSVVAGGTILAMGSGGGATCSGNAVTDNGFNLSSDNSCGFSVGNQSLPASNPEFGSLGNYGGTNDTLPLLSNSPAIDAGGTSTDGCPGSDQRGASRPEGLACDIGAYEAFAPAFPDSPTLGSITTGSGQLTVNWTGPDPNGSLAVSGYSITASLCSSSSTATATAAAGATTATLTGLTSGTYNVSVAATNTNGSGPTASSGCVTKVLVAPALTSLSVTSGPAPGGSNLSITGTSFTGATAVKFGTTDAASFTVTSDTQITAIAPQGSGAVDVTVTAPGGTTATSSADQFTYLSAAPGYTVSPNFGPGGGSTKVTITATQLSQVTDAQFGDTTIQAANFTSQVAGKIVLTSPAGTGNVEIVLDTPAGNVVAGSFSYLPVITLLTKTSATAGASDEILGKNLTGVTAVHIGGATATPTVVNDRALKFTVPLPVRSGGFRFPGALAGNLGPLGPQAVTIDGPGGTSTQPVTFTYLFPTLTSVTPKMASSDGVTVTIVGKNLTGTTAVNFGATPAASFTVVNDAKITATTPAGAGVVPVFVVTPAGNSNTMAFSFLPSITSISPTHGPVGTTVTLIGKNLGHTPQVKFGDIPVSPVTIVSPTTLRFTMPAGTGHLPVTIVGSGGASVNSAVFSYDLPVITTVADWWGPASGGTTLTVNGNNFTGTREVLFGSTPATSFTLFSDRKVTAVSPPGIGIQLIDVVTPAGHSQYQFGIRRNFDYAPIVGLWGPGRGPALLTTVTFNGNNLTGVTGVNFGTTAATNVQVLSDTKVTATVPLAPLGTTTVDVTIVGPGGTETLTHQFTYALL